jgi:uncharacterized membrane protein YsdA (DUF1294 family)
VAIKEMSNHRAQMSGVRRENAVSVAAIGALLLLLLIPLWALSRLAGWIDWRLLAAPPIAVSLLTFLAYRSDKHRAEKGEWRIPESTLHTAELLGGWPGAFVAQRAFRHKISKPSYQITYWVIVLFHQYVALDSLIGWKLTRNVVHFIQSKNA